MENALTLSLSNQMVTRRNMEVIANNIANMGTTGFKRESAVFEEYIVPVETTETGAAPEKENLSFVRDWSVVHDMSNGNLATTGAPLDAAIEGGGFFVVSTPQGERYTRNGHFGRDDTGRLVTSTGHPVLDAGGGEIQFAPDETQIRIANDGTISTENGLRGQLQLVTFDNLQTLKKEGDSLWASDQPATVDPASRVLQGMLEQSNVQPVVEMVRMIETMRSYQASTELLGAGEELSRRTIQRLGEVRA